VAGRFPKDTRVKVLVRNEKGKAVLDFKSIPVEQVDQLIEALAGQLAAHAVAKVQPAALPS